MASLNSLYIKTDTLKKLLSVLEAKEKLDPEAKGVELTISIRDEINDYGKNISAYVSQSKEAREAKKDKYYVGNGKTFWTDGLIKTANKTEPAATAVSTDEDEENDLPF